jgi:hypothetical protein
VRFSLHDSWPAAYDWHGNAHVLSCMLMLVLTAGAPSKGE